MYSCYVVCNHAAGPHLGLIPVACANSVHQGLVSVESAAWLLASSLFFSWLDSFMAFGATFCQYSAWNVLLCGDPLRQAHVACRVPSDVGASGGPFVHVPWLALSRLCLPSS